MFGPQTLLTVCLDQRHLSQKGTLKRRNALVLRAPLYGTGNWAITARDARRITAARIKYIRKTAA